ncbi:MAG: redox-sensing transcriptional repressor Rex, partial [Oscillospiraceae bacterium]|nr:redox-sensing transcriptional repressor Rex [Oscillospiraceae bacterium]
NNHTVIILGAGNLGRALIENFPFRSSGFRLTAAFDVDPLLVGTRAGGVPVYHADMLEEYVREHKPDVAVLTVPAAVAKSVFTTLMDCGVEGIWNFTNVELPRGNYENVKIENVHFADSLLTLSYMISEEKL